MRVLLVLVVIAAAVWALIEAIQADNSRIRLLPKAFWVITIILVPPIGAAAWFLLGRPKADATTTGGRPAASGGGVRPGWGAARERAPRPAPDDDPEFLRRLSQQAEQQKMLRLLEEGGTPEQKKKSEPEDGKDDKPGSAG